MRRALDVTATALLLLATVPLLIVLSVLLTLGVVRDRQR